MSPAVRGGVVVVLCLPLLPGCDARAPEPSPAPPPATAHARDPALDPPLVAPIRGDAAAARVHHAAGLRVLADGDVAAARTAFERALAVDPAGVDARIDLGFLLLEGVARGGFGAALEQFRLASLLVPDDPRAACGEGIVRVELGDFERAGPLLERAIAAPALLAFPGRVAAAQAALARIDAAAGRLESAQKRLQEAARLPGVPPPARANAKAARAELLADAGKTSEALAELDGALRLAPRQLAARHLRAQLRQRHGDARGAARDRALHEVLRQQSDHGTPRFAVDTARRDALEAQLVALLAEEARAAEAGAAPTLLTGRSGAAATIGGAGGAAAAPSAFPPPRFRRRLETGVDFRFAHGGSGRKHLVEITGAGVALLDHDGDGDLDLFLPQGAALPGHPGGGDFRDRLFRNDGDWRFTDVTAASGVSDLGRGLDDYTYAAACPDFDGDGDPDLYLCNVGRNRFLRNDGGCFVDVTAEWGGACALWSTAAVFADFDRDGDLDLHVVNYVVESFDHPGCGPQERGPEYRSHCHPDEFPPADDVHYVNEQGRLVDRTAELGMASRGGAGLGAVLSDFDGDGDVDIFVANDSTPNFLWRNDGDRFTEIGAESGVAVDASGLSTAAMGTDFADIDGDADFDLVCANLDLEPNTLYRNDGDGNFTDRSTATGIGPPSLRHVGFGCEFADFDLDGDPDLLVANGHVCDNIELLEPTQTFRQPPLCLVNEGSGRFRDQGGAAGSYFAGREVGRGLAVGDLDGDGDLDVVVAHWEGAPALLENEALAAGGPERPDRPRWIALALVGTGTQRDALGARATITAGGRRQVEEVRGASSYAAWNELALRFGLGGAASVEQVEIRWPDGRTSRHGPLAADRRHVLRQP